MSYAYTPGLKVKRNELIVKRRFLPVDGEVLVQKDEEVLYDTIIARTHIPGDIEMLPLAYILGVEPYGLPDAILKKEGEVVKEGELLGLNKSFFGLFKTEYYSKVSGTIELISNVTGQVGVRNFPVPINLDAYISGKVVEVAPNQGAIISAASTYIQGIFGVGGENHGEILIVAEPDEELGLNHIGKDCDGKIIVGGSIVRANVLMRAEEENIRGVITGGIRRMDLTKFLGYELGVAITGHEDINLTCIITEGFGEMNMAKHTFELLKSCEGKLASINGATQIRAGVIRPEIIIPHMKSDLSDFQTEDILVEGMNPGTRVRIIRRPYFGAIGTVETLPAELQRVESESLVRVMTVNLDDKRTVTVPRANVEIMEE